MLKKYTAILKVLSDILCAVDKGDLSIIVLLDLSACLPHDTAAPPWDALTVSAALPWAGWSHISAVALSSSVVETSLPLQQSTLEFRNGRS